jgi:signal transduction histidine kinase/CheY-like chemotaxis protein
LHADLAQQNNLLDVYRLSSPKHGNNFTWLISARRLDDDSGYEGIAVQLSNTVARWTSMSGRDLLLAEICREIPGVLFQVTMNENGEFAQPFYTTPTNQKCPGLTSGGIAPIELLSRIAPEQIGRVRRQLLRTAKDKSLWQSTVQFRDRNNVSFIASAYVKGDTFSDGTRKWQGVILELTELTEAKQQYDSAIAAAAAKTSFLARVSHELRTPLNGVLGFIQLMAIDQDNYLRGSQRDRLNHMESAARRLLAVINETLELNRIGESTETSLEVARVDLMEHVFVNVEQFLPMANAKNIDVLIESEPSGLFILGDSKLLNNVLSNLLSNAIKYNRNGKPVVLRTRRTPTEIILSVIDHGFGIEDDQIEYLFEPFNRLGAESSLVEGTGLGLTSALASAKAMGGSLVAHSKIDEGSVFTLTLQSADFPAPVKIGSAHPGNENSELPARKIDRYLVDHIANDKPFRILVAEDDRLNLILISEALRRVPNYEVTTVEDGVTAWAEIMSNKWDLLLLDINLPGRSGMDLVQALRADSKLSEIPCIAVSADALPTQVDAGKVAGFDDYWTKPIDLINIESRLKTTMASFGSASASIN